MSLHRLFPLLNKSVHVQKCPHALLLNKPVHLLKCPHVLLQIMVSVLCINSSLPAHSPTPAFTPPPPPNSSYYYQPLHSSPVLLLRRHLLFLFENEHGKGGGTLNTMAA